MVVTTRNMAAATKIPNKQQYMQTSGGTDAVWVKTDPTSNRPKFETLKKDINTDICIVGAGIAGISVAYELVSRGREVTLLEAREVLSGETGRTSGHLSNTLDGGYIEIAKKHGDAGATATVESHTWAIERVGRISKDLGIACEYRKLPGYEFSQYARGTKEYEEEIKEMNEEVDKAKSIGLDVEFRPDLKVKGWDGKIDQSGGAVYANQATFHPTKYLNGVLKWLKDQPKFQLFTHTRVMDIQEKGFELLGIGRKTVEVETESGNKIQCSHAVQATCVPLQKLSVVAEMEFMRTYCIAIRVPKGYIEDCLIDDEADAYKYVRLTACDEEDDYMVVGGKHPNYSSPTQKLIDKTGCDHKVGQESSEGRFEELETWTRLRFPKTGVVDFKWSGQVFEPTDHIAFIGLNQGMSHTYIVTGHSGHGLTHGVLSGKLIADQIEGIENPWTSLYAPNRLVSVLKTLPSLISHDLQINSQYKRFLQSDITDIEDLAPGKGGVLNPPTGLPIAVYKDEEGKVNKMSALCPHLKGVVCWNDLEKSWDCPVHGSRFSMDGTCVIGPSKGNLSAVE